MGKKKLLAMGGVAVAIGGLVWALLPSPPKAPAAPTVSEHEPAPSPAAGSPVFAAIGKGATNKGLVGSWHNLQRLEATPKAILFDTRIDLEANGTFRVHSVINEKSTITQAGTWTTQGERLVYHRTSCTVQGSPFGHDTCPDKPTPAARFKLQGDTVELQPESDGSPALVFERVIP